MDAAIELPVTGILASTSSVYYKVIQCQKMLIFPSERRYEWKAHRPFLRKLWTLAHDYLPTDHTTAGPQLCTASARLLDATLLCHACSDVISAGHHILKLC
jgi:hypothetical protein